MEQNRVQKQTPGSWSMKEVTSRLSSDKQKQTNKNNLVGRKYIGW